MGVNNLNKVHTPQRGGRGSNSRPLSHQSNALASRLSSQPYGLKWQEKHLQIYNFRPLKVS